MADLLHNVRTDALWLGVGVENLGRSFMAHISWRMLLSAALLAAGICVWVAGGPPNLLTDVLGLIPAGRERPRPQP
jgi:hypothetical protein